MAWESLARNADGSPHMVFEDYVRRVDARNLEDEMSDMSALPLIAPPETVPHFGAAFGVNGPLPAQPMGRLLTEAKSNGAPVTADELGITGPVDDPWVVVKRDVWEEVFPAGSTTPSHVLKFTKGQRVHRSQITGAVVFQEQSPPRVTETKTVVTETKTVVTNPVVPERIIPKSQR